MKTEETEESEFDALERAEAGAQKQLQEIRRQKRVVKMREARNQARAQMSEAELKEEAAADALYHEVFSTQAGEQVLDHMVQRFPAIADAFVERVFRHGETLKAGAITSDAHKRVADAATVRAIATGENG